MWIDRCKDDKESKSCVFVTFDVDIILSMELIPITLFLIGEFRIFSRELSAIDGAFLIQIERRTLVFGAEGGRTHLDMVIRRLSDARLVGFNGEICRPQLLLLVKFFPQAKLFSLLSFMFFLIPRHPLRIER